MRTAIFTCASGYTVEDARPFVESLKKIGYTGKVYAVTYKREIDELYNYLTQNGIMVIMRDYHGSVNLATQRFYDYSEIIHMLKLDKTVDMILSVDFRDVVFQADPFAYLESNLDENTQIYCSGEGITYRHEDWNGDTLEAMYGTKYLMKYIDEETICSGVFAGKPAKLALLFRAIHDSSFFSNDPMAFMDQVTYAIVVREAFGNVHKIVSAHAPWTANLGTLAAIPFNMPMWSTGPKGEYAKQADRFRKHKKYEDAMLVPVPQMIDGKVCNSNGEPYAIVHQYNRYTPWQNEILAGLGLVEMAE